MIRERGSASEAESAPSGRERLEQELQDLNQKSMQVSAEIRSLRRQLEEIEFQQREIEARLGLNGGGREA